MGFWGIILAITGFFIPVFMVSMYFVGIRCSLKTWSLIGLPFIAIGISGILFIQADSYRSTPEQVLIYSTAGWIILACALPPLVYALIKCIIEFRQSTARIKNDELARFYNECIQNNVRSCKSEKDRQKVSLIAKKSNISYTDIEALYNEAKQCYQEKQKADKEYTHQKELAELKAKEQAQYDVLNEFSSYRAQEKKIAMLTKEYNETARRLRATDDAISLTVAPPLEKEHDWAVMGGLANGLAGPGAGIATAVNTQIENAQIRARNSQILRETADIRSQMFMNGAKQKYALQARCSELNAMINETKTKLLGRETPKQCFDVLRFKDIMLSVSKTGTCFVNAKVGLKYSEYYIFSDVKATIDGTIQAEIYNGNIKIGTANLVLPLNGVPDDNMIAVKGMCLFCGQPGNHYSVKFNADNLWAMEQ